MVVLKKFTSSEFTGLSSIQGRLLYDSTSNVLRFHDSQSYNNVLVFKDLSNNITNINSLTATNLTGTLQTAAQPNITSLGTLTSLSTGSLTLNGTAITATALELNKLSGVTATTTQLNYVDITTPGTAEASKAIILDFSRNITNINSLTSTNLTGTLQTAAQPNITSVGTLTSLSIGELTLNGTAITSTAAEINKLSGVTATTTEINYVDITTIGTAEASKALIIDSSRNITNINNLTAANLTGTLQTASQPNITSVGTLTSLSTGSITLNGTAITATAAEINSLSGSTATPTQLNYINITTEGIAEASKALVLDASRNITNINSLTATNLTGTLQTAAQPNITSVGTLTSLSTGSLTLNGTAITATAAEINYNDITTIGTAQASKALIVDSNKDIQSIRRLHLANLSLGVLDYSNLDRFISAIDNTIINGGNKYLCMGKSYSTYNVAEWGYYHTSDGSTSNRQEFGFYGANGIFAITAGRKVGVNNTTPTYTLDVTGDINLTGSLRFAGTAISATAAELNKLSGVTATTAEINYLDITAIGTAQASKALILDASRDITNINSLTATNLTGTLQTAAQPNITSVGTLTSLSTGSLTLGGTAITATAAEINYLDITAIGTAQASKALILDASRDITNINNITITGLLSTTFQTVTLVSTYQLWTNNINTPVVSALKMGTTNAVLGTTSAHSFGLTTNNTERLSISSAGIVSVPNTTDSTNTTTGALLLSGGIGVAKRAVIGSSLHIGDTYDTTRALSILKSVANNSEIYFVLGQSNSNRNQFEFKFQYSSSSSTSNYGSFGIHTIGQMFILSANGNIGVYNTAPAYTFDVTGDINLTGSLRFGGVAITSSATELNYVDITTIGTGQASKALVLDASRNIININSLTATNLTGTLQTAAQPNITSVGTLTSLSTGSLTLGGAAITATAAEINYLDITTIGTGQASKALILDSSRDIININSLTATNLTGTLQTAAQPNITSVGTLTSLSTGSLTLGGTAITATASEINTLSGLTATTSELNYVDTTPGTAEASKALVLDSNLDIVGIHNIETDNLTVNGTLVTSSAVELNYVDVTTIGVAQASKALVLDANLDIVGIHNIETDNLTVNGTLITSSAIELNYVDVSSIGVAEASKALVVDSNRDITNINDLSATNLTGTLQTASQPNITSVGILTSLSTGSLTLNGTAIIATASEINTLDGITSTTTELNSLSGSTATSLDFNKLASITATATELNILDGISSTTSELNSLSGSTATASDFNKLASITATATELNILSGLMASTSELNILSGVTATSIELNKLDGLMANTSELNSLSGSTATTSDFNKLASVTASASELNTLSGITATVTELNYVDTTAGTASASKALILDSSRNITNINALTATNLTGTLQTAAQPNITSVGTLTSLSTGSLTLNGTAITATAADINSISGISTTLAPITGVTTGTAAAGKALILDSSRDITNINSLTATNLTGTLQTAAQPNITSVGTLTSLSTGSLTLNGTLITSTAADINGISGISTTLAPITGVTAGTAAASKAVILDASSNITNINSLTATNLTGTLQTAAQPNITSVGTLTSLSTGSLTLNGAAITATAAEINYNDITTIGTAQASKALIVDANKDIQSIRRLHIDRISIGTLDFSGSTRFISAIDSLITNGTNRYLCMGKSYSTYNEAEWGYFHTSDGSTSNRQEFGFYGANGIFAITAGRKVGINNTTPNYDLDVTGNINLTGSLQFSGTAITATAAELNKLSGVTATTAEINYLDITTIGTGEASKAVILDASRNITNINALTATNLTGTLQTATQPNITSVGTLTSLSTGSLTLNGTAITATAAELNKLSGVTATTAEINYLDITTIGTGEASKALVLDASRNIININALTATNLTGTLQTATQPNITSVGILTDITSSGAVSITDSTSSTSTTTGALKVTGGVGIGGATNIGGDLRIGSTSNKLILNSSSAYTNVTYGTASVSLTSGNVYIKTNNTFNDGGINYDMGLYMESSNASPIGFAFQIHNGAKTTTTNAAFMGTVTNNDYAIMTNNTRRLTISSTGNVSINNTNNTYRLDVSGDINLTGSLRFSGTAVSATAAELNKLSGVTATTAELNYLDITTIGTGEASKAVVLDASRNIININALTATNLTGTLQTAAQPNITSIGTLTSLSTGSLTLNGTAITATAAELNKLSGVTAVSYTHLTLPTKA